MFGFNISKKGSTEQKIIFVKVKHVNLNTQNSWLILNHNKKAKTQELKLQA
jgi:hypothetical protein